MFVPFVETFTKVDGNLKKNRPQPLVILIALVLCWFHLISELSQEGGKLISCFETNGHPRQYRIDVIGHHNCVLNGNPSWDGKRKLAAAGKMNLKLMNNQLLLAFQPIWIQHRAPALIGNCALHLPFNFWPSLTMHKSLTNYLPKVGTTSIASLARLYLIKNRILNFLIFFFLFGTLASWLDFWRRQKLREDIYILKM